MPRARARVKPCRRQSPTPEQTGSSPTVAPMPFSGPLLHDGEEVILDVRPHWWYLAGPVAVLVGGDRWRRGGRGPLAAVRGRLGRHRAPWRWRSLARRALHPLGLHSLVVTTSRLIRRTGVLARSGREIPLAALTDISYHQRLLQRLIGAGDLLLESAGRQGQEVFPDLPRPARIQLVIATEVDRARRQGRAAGAAPGAVVDTHPDRGARRAAPAGASSPTPSSRPRKPSCSIGCEPGTTMTCRGHQPRSVRHRDPAGLGGDTGGRDPLLRSSRRAHGRRDQESRRGRHHGQLGPIWW